MIFVGGLCQKEGRPRPKLRSCSGALLFSVLFLVVNERGTVLDDPYSPIPKMEPPKANDMSRKITTTTNTAQKQQHLALVDREYLMIFFRFHSLGCIAVL